jgi:hypothetical protein
MSLPSNQITNSNCDFLLIDQKQEYTIIAQGESPLATMLLAVKYLR